ncbi:error-prone DNA polymerase [Caulobacter sp. NIBR2454]|uniref:error-prone DNA polymerase n=1 Tax=Caulobacter sp. NIBR2454 TaxID=3015996 RepID=UPI0022B728E3|nr:error-prone DNA polymerase [Caulobacter sp. NIBR2454]
MTRYAELQTTSNYSFLRGASHPGELVIAAEALGMEAVGITDRNSLAGVVRAWSKAKDMKVRALTGCRLDFMDGTPSLLVYPSDREAFGRLTRLLTVGQRRAKKGDCHLTWTDFLEHSEGQLVLAVPPPVLDQAFERDLAMMAGELRGRLWIAASRLYAAQDIKRLSHLGELAKTHRAPMTATGDVLYHGPERRPLQDVLTCIHHNCTIQEAGFRLEANAERHMKPPAEMARLFARWPEAVERSAEIVERIGFDLKQLRYEYPDEPVPPGSTAIRHLTKLSWDGAKARYGGVIPDKVRDLLHKELTLIKKLKVPDYFLTVNDIVQWARSRPDPILCQGRGSAANSSVCFCLGVTAVDPTKPNQDLLFARFLSEERGEPPDIDVDFEHERREEVMQYVYERYGRHRAAICATVIHYRPRSAIRQVGKALGLTEDITAALANTVWGSWGDGLPKEHIRQAGLDPDNLEIQRAVALATELLKFPRHLSQHVGGYVLTKRRLDETVPIGNAAMKDRTFIEWDKDDIDEVGLMKVDILALGMLTAIKRAFRMLQKDHGLPIKDLAEIPQEAPEVYAMLQKADSVGVFQVESRAQMSMLPRLRPENFYDLAIQVAIVRPGPIQGNMVHPYLKRRQGLEPVSYPKPSPEHGEPDELESILKKTMGVPLFQEQAMRLAIEAAKFSEAEANQLRRCMATFKSQGDLGVHKENFIGGMTRRGYELDFAQRCFKQIEGFGSYGFPESHAVSFALLVYASAWIKCVWPDVFCAALINSQPMGFYQPAQLVRDARDNGKVEVRPPDILASDWDCTLEPATDPDSRLKAVRLGLRQVKGIKDKEALLLMKARVEGASTLADFVAAGLSRRTLELLAEADACRSIGMDRRAALWAVKGLAPEIKAARETPLLAGLPLFETAAALPAMSGAQHVAEDYRTTSLSLKEHPLAFFRERMRRMGCTPAGTLKDLKDGAKVTVAGLVLIRQRPGTAKNVTFLTLEDETGPMNAVVWQRLFVANRRTVMTSGFLAIHGKIQSESGVIHVVADGFTDLSAWLSELKQEPGEEILVRSRVTGRLIRSRDFH